MHAPSCGPGCGPGMGFGGIGHLISMLIFWALAIMLIVYLVKLVRGETALNVLQKRYAKGEITKEEFERMRDDITKGMT